MFRFLRANVIASKFCGLSMWTIHGAPYTIPPTWVPHITTQMGTTHCRPHGHHTSRLMGTLNHRRNGAPHTTAHMGTTHHRPHEPPPTAAHMRNDSLPRPHVAPHTTTRMRHHTLRPTCRTTYNDPHVVTRSICGTTYPTHASLLQTLHITHSSPQHSHIASHTTVVCARPPEHCYNNCGYKYGRPADFHQCSIRDLYLDE